MIFLLSLWISVFSHQSFAETPVENISVYLQAPVLAPLEPEAVVHTIALMREDLKTGSLMLIETKEQSRRFRLCPHFKTLKNSETSITLSFNCSEYPLRNSKFKNWTSFAELSKIRRLENGRALLAATLYPSSMVFFGYGFKAIQIGAISLGILAGLDARNIKTEDYRTGVASLWTTAEIKPQNLLVSRSNRVFLVPPSVTVNAVTTAVATLLGGR
jgi:hypothetical protein